MNDTPLATPAQIAKAALRRLATSQAEPTPANYARAYAEEAGGQVATEPADPPVAAPPAGPGAREWATLMERLVRGLERGHKQWSLARKKDSLQRVLAGNRSDAALLLQRLNGLLSNWEDDTPGDAVEPAGLEASPPPQAVRAPADGRQDEFPRVLHALDTTVRVALPESEPRALELADELARLCERIQHEGASHALADEVGGVCLRIQRLFGVRHELVDELLALCRTLTDSITDLAEEESWAQGQTQSLRERLDMALGARAVRAAREMLGETRERQRSLRTQQSQARDALKQVLRQMLTELGALDTGVGQFNLQVLNYADTVQAADTLESLASVVRQMVSDSQAVHALVASARERLASEHDRARELEQRVRGLESELRRLSDEAVTDSLTQLANRRGLNQLFAMECSRSGRAGAQAAPLAVGLLDVDNFKKLNDSLGHAAGDQALQALAARVKEWLRPTDHVARYGGEEFVVLLPGTAGMQAAEVLTRLQRRLSASLFMHEGAEVFVTFSAGVTEWRPGEALEAALARADEGLYEAKRTGKNRTCAA